MISWQKLPDARRQPIGLAIGLWTMAVIAMMGFSVSIGAAPFLVAMPILWGLHGLVLTWPLHAAIVRLGTQSLPAMLRWGAIGIVVVVMTTIQTLLDGWVSMHTILTFAPPGTGGALLFRASRADPGTNIGPAFSFMIYFWVFGCYAIAASLLNMQRRLADAVAGEQRAALTALRLQMNPHFLFNALNSLSTLILVDRPSEANAMTMRLSNFLRESLISDANGWVTLGEELSLIEDYLEIEKIRFPERLDVQFHVPENAESWVLPSYLLQPLVENAVKHAVGVSRELVTIKISAAVTGNTCEVTVANSRGDASAGFVHHVSGSGTGLKNVRARLLALYGQEAALTTRADPSQFVATVRIPASIPTLLTSASR